jgi:hypothetical protein
MATIMSEPRIWAFDRHDTEMRAALAAGWRRRDLWWERLEETANKALIEGQERSAVRHFRLAFWLARLGFPKDDPRRATALANLAFMARLTGSEKAAERHYTTARSLWSKVPSALDTLQIQPRAKSSLFHLRMEVKHWETYRNNMKIRLGKFIQETDEALAALSRHEQPPHRLFSRWRGEKPAVFDDTRKLLAACLLVASDPNDSRNPA